MYRFFLALLLATPVLAQTPVSIADARAGGADQTVTVAGRITVANQLGGPAYLQDATAGISVFDVTLQTDARLGDSVVVTGTTTEPFAGGTPGSGLLQIGRNVSFEIVASGSVPEPQRVAVAELDESFEGELVELRGVRLTSPATSLVSGFYTLEGSEGALVELFVDGDSDVAGLAAPADTFGVVGVVSQFEGRRLVVPRLASDVLVEADLNPVGTVTPIADLRRAGVGRRATIAGRLSVAGQFAGGGAPGGPLYLQDATGGLAFYDDNSTLVGSAQIGDSVVITGTSTEFRPDVEDGTTLQGTGLFQISGTSAQARIVDGARVPPAPVDVTIAEVGEGLEGQLVRLRGVRFEDDDVGALPTDGNLTLVGESGAEVDLRIDGDTDLAGADAPEGTFDVIGVVSQFRGSYQILPRVLDDLGVAAFERPGEDIPRTRTFEAATWNIENFGSDSRAPDSDEDQLAGAIATMRIVDADLYGVQEIADEALFRALVDSLEGYRGFLADYETSSAVQQRVGFVYRTSVVDSVSAGLLFTDGDNPFGPPWANGRWPLGFTFDATVEGETERITAVTLHAKALQTVEDRNRRQADSEQLKAFLDATYSDANLIVLGDFNDDVDVSNVGSNPSPYANFTGDADYRFVTASLSERGVATISGGSTIDHILISDELFDEHFDGTERAENIRSQVSNFVSTVSDHFPVWTRFDLAGVVTSTDSPSAPGLTVTPPQPNPARGAFVFHVGAPAEVGVFDVSVFDALGRTVRRVETRGGAVRVDVSDLPAGVYLVRIEAAGSVATRAVVVAR